MSDPRIEKLADLLVNYSVKVKQGDKVAIRSSTLAEPLLKAVFTKVLQAGGHPLVIAEVPGINEYLFKHATDEQLQYIHEPDKFIIDNYDVSIYLIAEDNTKALTKIDPSKMVTLSRARRELTDTFLRRGASGDLRWTLTLFPTHAHAQDAEMSLNEFEDFVYNACMPDMDDPIGYWEGVYERQEKIIAWLKGKDKVHITAPGTDLRLSVAGRTFINCACTVNVPDGEIFTGPVEDSVEGHVTFSYPAIYGGREVTGVQLWFEHGKVVKACATKNEDFLLETLDTDEGARYVGEFAIGTNEGITQFTREILFDEKIGGSFHMAVGSGYPETGSVNESSVHWDMICDLREGGEIRADGELLYQNGRFVLDL
jgi:aminopeptidase